MKIRILFSAAALLLAISGTAQTQGKNNPAGSKPFVVMFYNTENLYDTINDPAITDEEFTPSAKVPWTAARFDTKIKHLGQVITDISAPGMPDLIGLAETENRQVLTALTSSAALKKTGYGIVQFDSPDERGIDASLLYNPKTFKVLASEPLKVVLPASDRTRDILYVKGKLNSGEILHVFVNHWPSRREGTEKSEPNRLAAATVLRAKMDELRKNGKNPSILVMGDFNDEPSDKSITEGLGAVAPGRDVTTDKLCNLLYPVYSRGEGSLYYKDWDLFDQLLVSGNLLSQKKGLHTTAADAAVFRADYLLFTGKDGTSRPNRTMSGEKYFGGYSDHLPVVVKFIQQ
jgi:exonuclease III